MSIFEDAMREDWDAVVDKYRGDDRKLKITKSGDTALHLAARFGKSEHIRIMLEKIGEDEAFEILSIRNDRGNTVLHIAAELGDAASCYIIAVKDVRLLSLPNQEGANSLYVSVANGHGGAFYALDSLAQDTSRESGQAADYTLYKRNNGYTILHVAVLREHFELAAEITEKYPDLVNHVDTWGFSPLHILVRKRTAFRSASPLGFLDKTILPCLSSPQRNFEQLISAVDHSAMVCLPGCGDMFKSICDKFFSILGATIAGVRYAGLVLMKTLAGVTGIPWLNIGHLLQHGLEKRNNLREKKLRWELSSILLKELVRHSSIYSYRTPRHLQHDGKSSDHKAIESKDDSKKVESPFLIAAKLGVVEVADEILKQFPVAAFDLDPEEKNAALLACENKRVEFFDFMLEKHPEEMTEMLTKLDNRGNSALHLAAKFQDRKIVYTPEPASHLRAEYMWFKYVKGKMLPHYVTLENLDGKTPDDVFVVTHEEHIRSGSEWLSKTSESCSVISALIATVAFATLAVDGPFDSKKTPMFLGVSLFDFYCFFGLLALCFSIISLMYFLALRTSSFRVFEFAENLPTKLFLGLVTLLLSMVCILASFCFRHYSMLDNGTIKCIAVPIYVVASIRVLSLAASQLPFYHGLFFQSKFREPI